MSEQHDDRLRTVEQSQAVHEAVCAERYKAINLRLNIIMVGLSILLVGAVAGNPALTALRAILGS
jgi:hypothetical protein